MTKFESVQSYGLFIFASNVVIVMNMCMKDDYLASNNLAKLFCGQRQLKRQISVASLPLEAPSLNRKVSLLFVVLNVTVFA